MTIEAGDLACLKAIALLGGCRGPVHVSSQSLAGALSASPQTASRRLQSLEAALLVTRSVRPGGRYVSVSRTGEEALHREYSDYCRLFGRESAGFVMTGHVVSGVGEGRYCVWPCPCTVSSSLPCSARTRTRGRSTSGSTVRACPCANGSTPSTGRQFAASSRRPGLSATLGPCPVDRRAPVCDRRAGPNPLPRGYRRGDRGGAPPRDPRPGRQGPRDGRGA